MTTVVIFLLLGLACPLIAEWIRHRPANLTKSTQPILMVGCLGWVVFTSVAISALMLHVTSPSFVLAHHLHLRHYGSWYALVRSAAIIVVGTVFQWAIFRIIGKKESKTTLILGWIGMLVRIAAWVVAYLLFFLNMYVK